jgi:steroid 5-alpha reductase family enzyme
VPRGYKQADLDRGFLTSGMWAHSRHPNFLAEQTIWFVLYQWSCYACKVLFSYTGIGTFFLFGVFQGSTFITEMISSAKYPEYANYQQQVGMFLPTSFSGYKPPQLGPKVIRTSDLAKRQKAKLK